MTIFEQSLYSEALSQTLPDAAAGIAAVLKHEEPEFPSVDQLRPILDRRRDAGARCEPRAPNRPLTASIIYHTLAAVCEEPDRSRVPCPIERGMSCHEACQGEVRRSR